MHDTHVCICSCGSWDIWYVLPCSLGMAVWCWEKYAVDPKGTTETMQASPEEEH